MNNWWANKLAPTAPPPQRAYDPSPRQPAQVNFPQPQYRQPAPPEEQEWQPNTQDPSKVGEVLPIWHWKGNPRGGAAETQGCPACGSPRFFSRQQTGGVSTSQGVVYPRPECFECGYPNEQGTLGVPASVTAGAIQARQGESPAGPWAAR